MNNFDTNFYKNKKVLLTGHTGFKGAWLSKVLVMLGADLVGYALEPPTEPSLFRIAKLDEQMKSIIGDIRDFDKLERVFTEQQPEIVIHMAAQPIVKTGYEEPLLTYSTNVMGTVNLMECVRRTPSVKSVLNVTTDKVYLNRELGEAFTEDEPLDGFDPYSNSKSCSELVTHCYKNSYFSERKIAVSTARAGNVIGGGDFARDRIIPDCIRSAIKKEPIDVRNPNSTRPYQHVLEPLFAYLMICAKQYENISYAGYYNVGPDECDSVTIGDLADIFCKKWEGNQTWKNKSENGAPHEAGFLKLDCLKLKQTFNWAPHWHIEEAIEKTVEWSKEWLEDEKRASNIMEKQIYDYLE